MANKVLIIDDNDEIVEATTNLLEAKGYDVVSGLTRPFRIGERRQRPKIPT